MNKIQQAYEQGLRVRKKLWNQEEWIKKYSEIRSIDESGKIFHSVGLNFEYDLWELYTEPAEQPELNPIEQAYERGEKIRKKNWGNQSWYKKYDENNVITNCGNVYAIPMFDFNSIKNEPKNWEIWHEDLPLLKDQTDIKAQIQTHLNQIQELLKQL